MPFSAKIDSLRWQLFCPQPICFLSPTYFLGSFLAKKDHFLASRSHFLASRSHFFEKVLKEGIIFRVEGSFFRPWSGQNRAQVETCDFGVGRRFLMWTLKQSRFFCSDHILEAENDPKTASKWSQMAKNDP